MSILLPWFFFCELSEWSSAVLGKVGRHEPPCPVDRVDGDPVWTRLPCRVPPGLLGKTWPPRRGRGAEGRSCLPWEGAKELHWVPWADRGSQWRGGEPQRLSGQLCPGSQGSHGLSRDKH